MTITPEEVIGIVLEEIRRYQNLNTATPLLDRAVSGLISRDGRGVTSMKYEALIEDARSSPQDRHYFLFGIEHLVDSDNGNIDIEKVMTSVAPRGVLVYRSEKTGYYETAIFDLQGARTKKVILTSNGRHDIPAVEQAENMSLRGGVAYFIGEVYRTRGTQPLADSTVVADRIKHSSAL